jgi:hypothetical protein
MTEPDATCEHRLSLLRQGPRRSLACAATGAVLGLAIAGYGLFTAQGTRIAGVPPEDVALVNQVPILRSDYVAQLRANHDVSYDEATPQQRRDVLDSMIREELYVQRGLELGRATDDIDVRTALIASTEASTVADVLAEMPTDLEFAQYHQAHVDRYATEGSIHVEDLLLPVDETAETATLLRNEIASGKRPGGVSRTALFANGPEYYFAARIHLGPALFDAAAPLDAGQVSSPVFSGDRWHVLIIRRNERPRPLPIADVYDGLLGDLRREKSVRLEEANARFLRRRADVQISDDLQ